MQPSVARIHHMQRSPGAPDLITGLFGASTPPLPAARLALASRLKLSEELQGIIP